MAEFLSFLLFIALVTSILYLVFMLILPGLISYLGGVTMALLSATYLVRQDKHQARFASIPASKDVVTQVILLTFAMPVIHAALMWPIKDTKWVIWVFSVNMLLSLLWLVFFLIQFRRSVRLYRKENGEARALIGNIVARKEALNIKADSLRSILDKPHVLEPWEIAVLGNELSDELVDHERIKKLLLQINKMSGQLDEFIEKHESMTRQKRGNSPDCERLKTILKETEPSYKNIIESSETLINQYAF